MPNIYVIAGPNGAGKSTMAQTLLKPFLHCEEFVNADDIARGLSAFRPEGVALEAGRAMLRRLDDLAQRQVDFAFETTLASRSFAPWLRKRQQETFKVHLFFLWLPTAEIAIARVAARVAAGGHNIPEPDIRRRYERGIRNFFDIYSILADTWEVYDTSFNRIALMASGRGDSNVEILNPDSWHKFNLSRA
jgi:predicted ABC-type ATPase